jgi:hypothetical protein
MKKLRKYLITMGIGLAAVALIAWSKDVQSQTELVKIYHILCDSFFAVGIVVLCIGVLIFSSNEGTFDIIKYGLSSFFGMFKKNYVKKYDSFYDYRAEKAGQKLSCGFLVISGAVLVAISLVMYFLYSQC